MLRPGTMRTERWCRLVVLLIIIMVVVLSLVGQAAAQASSCPAPGPPLGLTQPQYEHLDAGLLDPGAGFMAAPVQSFLHTVQPNSFPSDLIVTFVEDIEQHAMADKDTIRASLVYEVGFLVCAAIGVVYIVLMPLVGFLLACCRCCGNCGGKMYQKQSDSTDCWRRTLYWSAFLTTLIILAGNVCMFRSNETFHASVDHGTTQLNGTLNNLHTYLTAVPQQIDHVINESYKTVDEVTHNLNTIGPQLGAEIRRSIEGPLTPALDSVRILAQEAVSTDSLLTELNSSLVQLESSAERLQNNLSLVKKRLNQTINKPGCIGCMLPELQRVTLDTSVNIPNLSGFQSAVDEVMEADLHSQLQQGEDYLDSIPQRVTNETREMVQESKKQLADIRAQIATVTSDFPVSVLSDASDWLVQVQHHLTVYTPDVERAEHIRWAVGVAVCCAVLLVVVCNVLGLLVGPCGLEPKADPTDRSCTADCAGTFLMMGAGFSFLFSWLFMIVVLVLFLVGGNVFTLICKPWSNGELLKFMETPGLIPGLDLGPALGLKSNLSLTEVYTDCEQNKPLWSTLHVYELVDLNHVLNVSQYTEEIWRMFDGANITLSPVVLLSPEVQDQLRSLPGMAGDVDFHAVDQQITNITSINLNATADKLDELANLQTDLTVKSELRSEAAELRQIQSSMETTIFPQLEKLNSTAEKLRSVLGRINGTVSETLSRVGAAQDFLNSNTTPIIKAESRQFVECQLGYFTAYADWANMTITQQVGRCGPVAGAVDSAETIVCANVVESLNAFWFSLGWCLIFFIPSIICSIKLAKYYRRMDESDVYDNHIAMNHIPRAQMKPF